MRNPNIGTWLWERVLRDGTGIDDAIESHFGLVREDLLFDPEVDERWYWCCPQPSLVLVHG